MSGRGKGKGGRNAAQEAKVRQMREQQQRWMKDRQATISGSPRSSPAFPAVSSPASRNSGAAPHGGHGVRSDWLPSARQHQPHPQQHQERPSHDHAHAAAAYTTANGPDVLYSPRPIYSDLPSANAHMDGVAEVAARLHTESSLAAAQEEKRRERENVEMRLFLMQEEVDDLMGYMEGCSADDAHEQGEISRLDRDALELDRQVKEFMERIKERKHALACERATHETKIGLIGKERGRLADKLAITQKTIASLNAQLR